MSDHLDKLAIDTIRTLSMDAVQKANSGHPGTPMALAPLMYTLWQNHLRYDPANPLWPGRDRFVLSAGHASMLLYSTLFLAQTRQLDANGKPTDKPAVSLEEIERFRQLGSKTPGHRLGGTSVSARSCLTVRPPSLSGEPACLPMLAGRLPARCLRSPQ